MVAAKLWTWWDTRTSKHKNSRDSNSIKPLFVKSTGPFIKKYLITRQDLEFSFLSANAIGA